MIESIDTGFLERMGYEFNEDKTMCRQAIPEAFRSIAHEENWRDVQTVIEDYVDFWKNSGEEGRLG